MPPSWEVLPALAEVSHDVALRVLIVSFEAGLSLADWGSPERFRDGVRDRRLTLLARDREVLRTDRVVRSPSYVLLDGKGVVSWIADEPITGVVLVDAVRAALKGG